MSSEFAEATRNLFLFNYQCWECGRNLNLAP